MNCRWCSLRGVGRITAWVLVVYFLSYVTFSRVAYLRADAANAEGFYFFFPSTGATTIMNDLCFVIYWPLVQIEELLGTGRPRAADPLRRLSVKETLNSHGYLKGIPGTDSRFRRFRWIPILAYWLRFGRFPVW